MECKAALKGIRSAKCWLRKRGWNVVERARCRDVVNFDEKQVYLSLHSTPEHQLFSILHECGHIIAGGKKAILEIVNAPYAKKRTDAFCVSCVLNEARAWDAGEKLAKRLGIVIDRVAYENYRARYLRNYMRWALRIPKDPEEHLNHVLDILRGIKKRRK